MKEMKPTRPERAQKVTPPEPLNKYEPKERIGKPTISQTEKVTKVGLGGLKVITN